MDESKLEQLMSRLSETNSEFALRYEGLGDQPVHTLYGGANLYQNGSTEKLSRLSQRHFQEYAPDAVSLADALGLDSGNEDEQSVLGSTAHIVQQVFERVKHKLQTQAIEDHRVDFEDGYGVRSDEEEDGDAIRTAIAMSEGLSENTLPPFTGIRIKALSEEAKHRSLATLKCFIDSLLNHSQGVLPQNFTVTLPKVVSQEQVSVICDFLDDIEHEAQLESHSIRLELMLENVQCLFDSEGRVLLPKFIAAARGRVTGVILGTFDYTASCNIPAHFQSHTHPAADFARQMLISCLTGTNVSLSDGITNIMPIPPHKSSPHKNSEHKPLTKEQIAENEISVHAAWKLHFDNISHSLSLGIYQGWDLNPAQIPIRYAAIYYFFLVGLEEATQRLKTFVDKAAQASMVGNTFDDAATGQGLVNYFVNGIACGALTESEVLATGVTMAELKERSFKLIVDNRIKAQS